MNISKNIKDGHAVCYKGGKVIKAGRKTKLNKVIGIWQDSYFIKILLPNGKKVSLTVPAGIVYEGRAFTKISK